MSEVVDFNEVRDLFPPTFLPHTNYSNLFYPPGKHVDVCFLPRKRCRITAPFYVSEVTKLQPSIDSLPDGCLFEILRRIPSGVEKSRSACVSKRWLMLLSNISRNETCTSEVAGYLETDTGFISDDAVIMATVGNKYAVDCSFHADYEEQEFQESESYGYLSRSLQGKKATDVRLASIAIGTAVRGGLGKLSIRGSKKNCGLTNLGLKAIALGCPYLKVLSLWNLSSIGDEGLSGIFRGCRFLEKLDLSHCPGITDRALIDIATQCPSLTSVTIESCANIGNESLKALGICPNLKYVAIRSCPLVSDQGIASLFSSVGHILERAKLEALNISDVSMAIIGHYGRALLELVLIDLHNVKERGFWVMGKAGGLQKLKSLTITSCLGASDLGIQLVSEGFPDLKAFVVCKCPCVTDRGLIAFTNAAKSLETLKVDTCNGITQYGVFVILENSGQRLKHLSLENCLGVKDLDFSFSMTSRYHNLRSLTIVNCPEFGDSGLSMFGALCPKLTNLNLIGLSGISDAGLLPLVHSSEDGLVKVTLSGCHNLTDKIIASIADLHGVTLEVLNLDGCRAITDSCLIAVARSCLMLSELDISFSEITDSGLASLTAAPQLNLQVLALQGCSSLTEKSLPFLVALSRTLVGLNVKNCHGISSGIIDVLLDHMWSKGGHADVFSTFLL